MKMKRSIISISIASLLAACGGSGSSDSPNLGTGTTPAPTPPVSTTVTTTGVITGFGSIIVNGVHYQTNGSAISTDDSPAAIEGDLAVGMMVTIDGTLDDDGKSGNASRIRYNADVEGIVTRIDLANQQLRVLGQWVSYDDLTQFDGISLNRLRVGDVVEVSGYRTGTGSFYASRIELEDNDDDMKVRGLVSALDSAVKTFMLGELTVNYASAELEDFGNQTLANDLWVKVEGSNYDAATNTLIATEVELQQHADDDSDVLKLEGIVVNYQSGISLELAGRTIYLDNDTDYHYGVKADLADGISIKLKAERENGRWVAEDIVFIREAMTKIAGMVSAVDVSQATLTVAGETFLITAQTQFEDDSDKKTRFFDLNAITVNDYVKVVGYTNTEGQQVALKIERDDDDEDDVELKGKPTEIGTDFIVLFGKTIMVDANTDFEDDDKDISQAEFFSRVSTATLIEVDAVRRGEALVARKLEIERNDDNDQDDDQDESREVEFKGLITAILDNGIEVDGITVVFNANTELSIDDDKLSVSAFLSAVKVGEQVEVEGVYNAQNQLIADEVDVERADD